MNSFENYFSLYEATDPPPIITKGYQDVKDSYMNYLNYTSDIQPIENYEARENIFLIKTEPPKYQTQDIYSYTFPTSNPISGHLQQSLNKHRTQFSSKKDYIKTMYGYIYKALQDNGLDANKWAPILVAQTALESGWGNSFSRRTNNYGGIKGKGSGRVSTKEWSPGKGFYTIKDEFKSYPTIQAFADDYVKLLKNRFNAFKGNVSDFVYNIRSRGYFTAPLSSYQKSIDSILQEVNKYLS